ncbi:MAG: TonB-dependent receptor [Acidobacteria bacterium]|nr:TonB-dependent receptor [Acidobacteriota bacterium]
MKNIALCVAAFLILITTPVYSQVSTATISGTVRDTTDAVIPGATITATNVETGLRRTATSDAVGRYSLPNLEVGSYEVRAEAGGFQSGVRTGITLTVGREAVVEFVLSVGQVAETVTVTGEAPLVETTSTAVGTLVSQAQMRDLPLNGRNYDQLTLLVPGVQQITTNSQSSLSFGGRGLRISVAGARPEGQGIMLDNTNIQGFWNQGAGASIAGTTLGVEAIREFQTITNTYSAEFGRSAGAVINAVTRSGTNELHGSVYEFHRNDDLDARNFFDAGKNPPPFVRNQYGFALGGPIKRDKTFFFGNYEGLRERLSLTRLATVPDENARRGLLPGREPFQVAPAVKPILDAAYPLPNGRNFRDGTAEFISSRSRPIDDDFFMVRIDHTISDSDLLFGRFFFEDASITDPYPQSGIPGFPEEAAGRNQYVTLEEKRIISPTVVNAARFSLVRTRHAAFNGSELSALQFLPGRQLGHIVAGTLSTPGPTVLSPFQFIVNTFTWTDDVSFTKGGHTIKFGGEVQRLQNNYFLDFFSGGRYSFNSLQDLLQNRPFSFIGAAPDKLDTRRGWRQTLLGFYFQDNYRVIPRLTLNLGLRYEFSTNPVEVNGKLSHLKDPIKDTAFSPVKHVFAENPATRIFGPRFGFAWDVTGDRKTSVRGGFGIFHNIILPRLYAHVAFNPPLTVLGFSLFPTFPNPLEKGVAALAPSISQVVAHSVASTPYMMQYNLNIERELFRETVVRVAYVGSRGVHLVLGREVNPFPVTEILPGGRKFRATPPPGAPRVNPSFGSINMKYTDANSVYNSMQFSVERRLGAGLQFQTAYTFSKSIDDTSVTARQEFENSQEGLQDPDGDRSMDRGRSNFDVRHNFTANFIYDLPLGTGRWLGGWQLSTIISASSGPPFTADNGFDRANTGRSGVGLHDRPNLRPGADNNPKLGNVDQWFDPASFELQPAGFLGNLGRNTLEGPGIANVDFSVLKDTPIRSISESFAVQFRAEFFNIFNRANFGVPNPENRIVFTDASGIPSRTAGLIKHTVTTSREIQFGLKLIF